MLGDHALQDQMPQLGVGQQVAIDEDGGADAGPHRDEDDDPLAIPPGTKAHLGEAGRIGVVQHVAGQAGHVGKQMGDIGLNPALVDIGSVLGDAVVDGGGEAAAHRALPLEVLDQRLEGVCHGGRGGRLRRRDAVALANQLPGLGVDQAPLDPGPTNIYSQHLHQNLPFIVPMTNGRQSMKKWLRSDKGQIVYA